MTKRPNNIFYDRDGILIGNNVGYGVDVFVGNSHFYLDDESMTMCVRGGLEEVAKVYADTVAKSGKTEDSLKDLGISTVELGFALRGAEINRITEAIWNLRKKLDE